MSQHNDNLAAIILAAGCSKRFGKANKLHALLESNVSVVERVLQLVNSFPFQHRIVVSAPDDELMLERADQYSVNCLVNGQPENGIGTSISRGVWSLNEAQFSGVAIFLGDMPFLTAGTISNVVDGFFTQECRRIVRPTYSDQVGHPVVFPSIFFGALRLLQEDRGADSIIRQHAELLYCVDTNDKGILQDVDKPSDLF